MLFEHVVSFPAVWLLENNNGNQEKTQNKLFLKKKTPGDGKWRQMTPVNPGFGRSVWGSGQVVSGQEGGHPVVSWLK